MDAILGEILNYRDEALHVVPEKPIEEAEVPMNMLEPEARAAFREESIYCENSVFSVPIVTTVTMEGKFSGVQFHEKDLTTKLKPTPRVVMIKSNYGKIALDGYEEAAVKRKSNRGRKRKEKQKKPRKHQGSGEDFNSQITFTVISGRDSTKVYKIKVFRTGRIQLPGMQPAFIDDVIECLERVADIFNDLLKPPEPVQLVSLRPVMKNYKFVVKDMENKILKLSKLKELLLLAKPNSNIFDISYTRQNPKLAIEFLTPTKNNPMKKLRVNIFLRGKINILGGLHAKDSRAACDLLYKIFAENRDVLCVTAAVTTAVTAAGS